MLVYSFSTPHVSRNMQVPTNDKTENNFRYCCKCKDYIDSSQFQNNELEKSKSNVCNKHTNTTEPPDTLRFCRKCNKHIPVSLFHSGQKRFMCRKHCAIRIAAKCIQNQTDIPGKANSDRAWKILSMWIQDGHANSGCCTPRRAPHRCAYAA